MATYFHTQASWDTNFCFQPAAATVSACKGIRKWLAFSSVNFPVILSQSNATLFLGLRFCFLAGCHILSAQNNSTVCMKQKDTRVKLFQTKYWLQFSRENEIPRNAPICAPSFLSEWGIDDKKLELLTSLATETLQYCRCPKIIYEWTL